jgi:ferrous iron transport protein B
MTTIALAGNPNCGKTSLFNVLTGARQHVGNYPGVTVEKKQGLYLLDGKKINLVDLPGMYSLTAYSLEELVARNFLVTEKPGAVVNIVDASNLERNLYLTVQLMELGLPLCLSLNMVDVADRRGLEINAALLGELLNLPVVPTVARNGRGSRELMQTALDMRDQQPTREPLVISYGADLDQAIDRMVAVIQDADLDLPYPARWIALKFLEKDEEVRTLCRQYDARFDARLAAIADEVEEHLEKTLQLGADALIADHRYGFIRSLLAQGVVTQTENRQRYQVTEWIDRVVLNRLLGPVIMIAVLLGLYQFTFTYSEVPVGWCENLFTWLGDGLDAVLADGLLKSLLISGIVDGVGGVLGFVPLIAFMFFGIALLEDSGYLARVAFMLDRLFRMFGLHGNSVMPFIVSGGIAGGCAVPGVMATRTIKSPRERLATLLTAPFMNCGAKLPVFALLIAAFFPGNKPLMMFAITMVSWAGALLVARLLRSTVVRGESSPFVMELPPYRLPTFRGLAIHTWERTWQYIKKAGTVILGISILLWALMTFPQLPATQQAAFDQQRRQLLASADAATVAQLRGEADLSPAARQLQETLDGVEALRNEAALRHSVAGRIGTALEGATRWAGFDWRTNIALLGGFAAKEVVVSTLGTAYSLGEVDPEETDSLSATLARESSWSPATALSLIVFTIFYAPCFVTVVCIAREAGSWKWGAFSMTANTLLAFALSTAVYQIGTQLLAG